MGSFCLRGRIGRRRRVVTRRNRNRLARRGVKHTRPTRCRRRARPGHDIPTTGDAGLRTVTVVETCQVDVVRCGATTAKQA